MNSEKPGNNFRFPIVLLVLLLLSISVIILFILSIILFTLGISQSNSSKIAQSPEFFMLASGMTFIGLLLIPGIFFSVRWVMKIDEKHGSTVRLNDFVFLPLLITSWLACILLGGYFSSNPSTAAIILPILTPLTVGLPILFYVRVALRNLKLPTITLNSMVFGTSLIIPPILAMIAELLIILSAIIVMILIIPEVSDTFYRFQSLLSSARSNSPKFEQEIFNQLTILFKIPAVTIFTLAIFSIFVPLIEETFKIIMLIPLGAIISEPDLGFVLGILCGAAFALVENVGFTSSGVNDWTLNILTRSTAALPHIFNSGIIGWTYLQTIKDRKWHKLLLAFCLAIFIHGIWNGASISMAINSLNPGNANDVFFQNAIWFSLWGLLTLGTLAGIVFVNKLIYRRQRQETFQKAGV